MAGRLRGPTHRDARKVLPVFRMRPPAVLPRQSRPGRCRLPLRPPQRVVTGRSRDGQPTSTASRPSYHPHAPQTWCGRLAALQRGQRLVEGAPSFQAELRRLRLLAFDVFFFGTAMVRSGCFGATRLGAVYQGESLPDRPPSSAQGSSPKTSSSRAAQRGSGSALSEESRTTSAG